MSASFLHPQGPVHPRDTLGVRCDPAIASQRLRGDLARWIGRRIQGADLEDLVQETLAEALRSRAFADLRSEEEVRRFVFAIARQRVADWFRRQHRERRLVTRVDEGSGSGTPGGVTAPAAGSRDLLRWASRTLPGAPDAPRTFEWLLREGEGETLAEIAESDGVAPLVVRQRVSRLRRLFRKRWAAELSLFALVVVVAGGVIAARRGSTVAVRPEPSGSASVVGITPEPPGPRAGQEAVPSAATSSAAPAPSAATSSAAPALSVPPPPPPSASVKPPSPPPSPPAPSASGARPVGDPWRSDPTADGARRRASPRPTSAPRASDPWRSAPTDPSRAVTATPDAADPWSSSSAPGQATSPFSRAAAAAALSAVNVATCASPASNAPGHLTVTFAESGKVTNAVVDSGSFSPDERHCVEGLFERVKVPAFSGAPVKVGKSFVLRVAPPRSSSCDPPYEIDASGHRKYKPACLRGDWGF